MLQLLLIVSLTVLPYLIILLNSLVFVFSLSVPLWSLSDVVCFFGKTQEQNLSLIKIQWRKRK